MRESKVNDYLVAQVAKLGGETRKVKWEGRRGAPDRFVILDDYSVWAEIKRPKKGAEAHQLREHERIRRGGNIVLLLDTFERIDNFVLSYRMRHGPKDI